MKHFTYFIVLFFLLSAPALAYHPPSLYFDAPRDEWGVGSEVVVEIKVDTDQPLNAYSLKISYPTSILEFVAFNNAGSIVDLMRNQPQVFEGGVIEIEGASLRPFSGEGGLIGRLVFKVIAKNEGELGFSDSNFYLANGKGTKVSPSATRLAFLASDKGAPLESVGIFSDDVESPKIEYLSFVSDPVTEGRRLLGFLVKDENSGVKEILVQYRRWFWWGGPVLAQNPTALPAGVWSVRLLARDNAGNLVESEIYDWKTFFNHTLLIFLALLFFLFVVINRAVKYKRVYNN